MRKFLLAAMVISGVACGTTQVADRGLGQPTANVASSQGNATYSASQPANKPQNVYEPYYLNEPVPGGP